MRRYKITTAWVKDEPGQNPWLLDSYDEITEDEWGGTPEYFTKSIADARYGGADVRIIELFVDYNLIAEQYAVAQTDVNEVTS